MPLRVGPLVGVASCPLHAGDAGSGAGRLLARGGSAGSAGPARLPRPTGALP